MRTNLLLDNWTLQNAGEFLCQGLDGDTADELIIPAAEDSFHYQEVSSDLMRFDALSQLVTNLVLTDELWVDEQYADRWSEFQPLLGATTAGVVVPKGFSEMAGHWIRGREVVAEHLCVNKALLKAHRKNKRQWAKSNTAADPMLSQIIWGGAGMLARADFFGLPYSPHPQRAKLVQQARFMKGPVAGARVAEFVSSERLKIYRQIGKAGFTGTIQLPPIMVQVIEESSTLSDLVSTAIQLRDDYVKVREWMGQLQSDLNNENIKEVLAHERRLQSISRHLDSFSAVTPPGDTTVQFGISWLKIGFKGGSPINSVQNKFGMRAEVNRMVLAPTGHNALKKLMRMLGEEQTKRGERFKNELIQRSSATP